MVAVKKYSKKNSQVLPVIHAPHKILIALKDKVNKKRTASDGTLGSYNQVNNLLSKVKHLDPR